MGVRELLGEPRLHRLRDVRRDRRRCLVIEIDHAAAARLLIRRHSSRNRSTSPSLVCGPKLTRRKPDATSAATFIAASTWLAFILPEEQALPAETAIPARSSW